MLNELVRWSPFEEELSSWHRDIDDLFGRFFGRPGLRPTLLFFQPRRNLCSVTPRNGSICCTSKLVNNGQLPRIHIRQQF